MDRAPLRRRITDGLVAILREEVTAITAAQAPLLGYRIDDWLDFVPEDELEQIGRQIGERGDAVGVD